MNLLNENDRSRQAARAWSERLGSLAAASPATRPEATFLLLDKAPPPLPTRLLSILDNLRQRHQEREHAADKLRANEFMMAP
jgi:hypothetical protein